MARLGLDMNRRPKRLFSRRLDVVWQRGRILRRRQQDGVHAFENQTDEMRAGAAFADRSRQLAIIRFGGVVHR